MVGLAPKRVRASSSAAVAALGAAGCLLLLALTAVAALFVPAARARDVAALHGFTLLDQPPLRQLLHDAAQLADPLPYAVAGLALLAVAVVRGRWVLAGLLPVLLVGSGATTQALKHALAHPRVAAFLGSEQISATAWPSGHATAAMTLALAAVLVAPARHRPVVALAGAAFAALVAYAVLVLAWHLPSDALGGFLVAAAWALGSTALLALVRRDDPRAPTSAWQAAGVLALLGATAVFAAVAAAALVHPAARVAVENASFLAVLVAVAALAAVLALGVSRAAEG